MDKATQDKHAANVFKALLVLKQLLRVAPNSAMLDFMKFCGSTANLSHAQFFQDLLVLYLLKGKKGGYFVEFGATDGVEKSNSLLLESRFGWNGILAEPARCWHEALAANRKAAVDTRCVWSASGEKIEFREVSFSPEFSTVVRYADADLHADKRQDGETYFVETVSLNDLLQAHGCPPQFDYLSMDTEGSELEILESFDFSLHRPLIMTIEHNDEVGPRTAVRELLAEQGYANIFPEISQVDDWFISRRDFPGLTKA